MQFQRRRSAGFTLLELLVVLFIIGVVASIVVVSIVGSDHKSIVRHEADRMVRTIELARREATLRNELWGVLIDVDQYEFRHYEFESEEWLPIDRRPYVGMVLKEDYLLRYTVPDAIQNEGAEDEGPMPQIVIEPTGEITPFQVDVYHDGSLVTTTIGTDGFKQVQFIDGYGTSDESP